MDLSSSKTELSSNKYPHTRAIAVQEAKFKTIQANSPEEAQQKAQQYINQFRQQAEQRAQQAPQAQQRTQQNQAEAPTQQQQRAQAPQEPKQQAPQEPKQQAPTQQQQQAKAPAEKQPETQQPTQGLSQAVQQVIELTNAERRKNGLSDLKGDTKLSGVAQKKSEDMRQNHYFSHTSPTYGSPFDMMRDFGVTYKTAGENIAQGQQTPQQVVQAWMNSEGHRKNILSKDFTHIGVGYDQNGHHWTQMFIGK
ncbi:SCP-like extracellular protein [Metabacillus sp. BG109]|uniref:SCP-like extracellular protein n=2 Tax=Metabacillus bambusae TaxID=2795218 RepID=A0ABS3N8W5_9BACI|nr:SCP-like extracellular protein [Metabacillus bambusae]